MEFHRDLFWVRSCLLSSIDPTLLFADDTEIFCHIPRNNGSQNDDSHKQTECLVIKVAASFQLYISKCKSLHLGRFNAGHVHNMNGHSIEKVSEEGDNL